MRQTINFSLKKVQSGFARYVTNYLLNSVISKSFSVFASKPYALALVSHSVVPQLLDNRTYGASSTIEQSLLDSV